MQSKGKGWGKGSGGERLVVVVGLVVVRLLDRHEQITGLQCVAHRHRDAGHNTVDRRRADCLHFHRRENNHGITGTFPCALCYLENAQAFPNCYANSGNPELVAPCGTTGCCDLEDGAAWDDAACLTVEELLARAERAEARAELAEKEPDSCRCDGKGGSIAIIIPVVIAAVLLVAAVLYLVRKRVVAALQLHRQSSMPTIGGDDEAEVEA